MSTTIDTKYEYQRTNIESIPQREVLRGEIYLVKLDDTPFGSEMGKTRPCLIIQNDVGNKHSPTTIVAVITSKFKNNYIPTHKALYGCGLIKPSVVEFEQIRTIDKERLVHRIGYAPHHLWENALRVSLGF